MDQEEHAPASKRRTIIKEGKVTHDSIVQNVNHIQVNNSVCSAGVGLTDDAWLLVLSYLGTADRTRIAGVCRRWRELVRITWKSITRLSFELFKLHVSPTHHLTDDLLEAFLRQCGTRLQSLNLDLSSDSSYLLTPHALDLVSLYEQSLQELNLSHVKLSDTTLRTLVEKLPRLRFLSLENCDGIDEDGLWWALKMLQSLKSLNIGGNKRITGEFFSQAPPSLTKVIAWGSLDLTDKGVRLLAERCPKLEIIDISLSSRLTGQSITDLVKNCPKLKSFKFNMGTAESVLTSHLLTLSNLTLLEELHVDWHTAVTNEVFYELGRHCRLLRSISCVRCYNLTDSTIFHLYPCHHLESINLSDNERITDKGLIQLSSAHSKLKRVVLKECRSITDKGVGELCLTHPNLVELDLSKCTQVTDGVLQGLHLSLQRRHHAQPLKIRLKGTSVDQKKAADLFGKRTDVTFKEL